jgi:hypothetical protein
LPLNTFSQSLTVCSGQIIIVGTHTYNTSGNYTDVLNSYQNCDSTVTTHLTVLPTSAFSQTLTICSGQSITIGSNTYTANGVYTDVFTSHQNCDSTVTTQLIVNSADASVSVSSFTLTSNASPAIYQWINCDNGNTPIAGQTNQNFNVPADGNYAVIVTQNLCTDTSTCYNISFTGITENNFLSSVNFYPNPNTGAFTLDFCTDNVNVESLLLEIFNPLGKLIYMKQFLKTNTCIKESITFDSGLAEGVYILKMTLGNRTESRSLMIVK